MRVAIVGAGAMGSMCGGLLAAHGHDVTFLDPWREHMDAIARQGLRLTCEGEERRVRAHATADPPDAAAVDLAMVWCKSYSTRAAMERARPLVGDATLVCTLQNGLGNVEAIGEVVPQERVVYGVTTLGGDVRAPGHVELTRGTWDGAAPSWLGVADPRLRARAEWVAEVLGGAGMLAEVRDDVDSLVWNKLAMACSTSGLAALTRLPIGALIDDPRTDDLVARMTREISAVAAAKGIDLDAELAIERNRAAFESARSHLPSMLPDVLARRHTEIEALCGAVVGEGERLGVPAPVNEIVYELVSAIERHYHDQAGAEALAAART